MMGLICRWFEKTKFNKPTLKTSILNKSKVGKILVKEILRKLLSSIEGPRR